MRGLVPVAAIAPGPRIPLEVRAHTISPRLTAVLSYLSGRYPPGKLGAEEFTETVFDVPISQGTVAALGQQMSAALPDIHDEARCAAVEDTDETGWKQADQGRWLWTAATATIASYVIRLKRD
jgi:hypothetical protein